MSNVKHVEGNDLESVLGSGDRPALIDFHAEWCGPCKAMSPAIDALADEMADSLTVAKVDIDKNQDLAVKYNVGSVPTLMLFVGAEQKGMRVGALGKAELRDWVNQTVGAAAQS